LSEYVKIQVLHEVMQNVVRVLLVWTVRGWLLDGWSKYISSPFLQKTCHEPR